MMPGCMKESLHVYLTDTKEFAIDIGFALSRASSLPTVITLGNPPSATSDHQYLKTFRGFPTTTAPNGVSPIRNGRTFVARIAILPSGGSRVEDDDGFRFY